MSWKMASRVLVVGAVAVIVGQAALAAIPDKSGVIHGCYSSGGALRVINSEIGQRCKSTEKSLNWNQKGVQGEPGSTALAALSSGGFSSAEFTVGTTDPISFAEPPSGPCS